MEDTTVTTNPLNTLVQRLLDVKQDIKNAIASCGVTDVGDNFESYAAIIREQLTKK